MSGPRVPGSVGNGRIWSRERAERFARDWNDGMAAHALREKYGFRGQPGNVARSLRLHHGLTLAPRWNRKLGPRPA